MKLSLCLIILSFIIFYGKKATGQLMLKYNYTPEQLVKDKLLGENGGIKILSTSYMGSPYSIAYFINNTPCFESKSGIILSTGYAQSVATPNKGGRTGSSMGTRGDRMLNSIVQNRTNDAAILYINFISYTDSIYFRYFFGSEEYPEFVDKGVNDVFAFFVKKKDEVNYKNIAHLKDGTPVTVDHINHKRNKSYYKENKLFYEHNYNKFKENREQGFLSQEFMFDGFTVELFAGTKVEPFKEYELVIAIADVGDDIFDSGVFLEAGSFKAANYKHTEINKIENRLTQLKNNFSEEIDIKHTEEALVIESRIEFEFNKHEINKKYINFLDKLANTLNDADGFELLINGHTDSVGSKEYNQTLSYKRALSIANYLVTKGISRYLIKCQGYGSTQPLTNKNTEEARSQNRRVEFLIKEKKVKTF